MTNKGDTTNDLIHKNKLIAELHDFVATYGDTYKYFTSANLERMIEEAPLVDAVEIVRCENCKYKVWDEFKNCYYCNKLDFNLYGDRVLEFFCACGDDE